MTWLQFLIVASLIINICCNISKKFNYYFRNVVYSASVLISAVIFVPLMLHRPRDSKNGLLPSWGARFCTKYLLGISYEVRGLENVVPEGQGCVVLINHQHAIDITVMSYIWPYTPKGCMIAKKEVLYMIPFGPATWFWGTVFVDRLNAEKAQKTINITGEHITSRQARICMFPEGTRHIGDTMLPFKKGAFHIAVNAQCPIQPVVVSKYDFIETDNYKFGSGHSIIEFLPAIPTKGLSKADIPQLIENVREVMHEGYTRITQERSLEIIKPS